MIPQVTISSSTTPLYFGVVSMAETLCARCGVVILPKAPRVIGGGRNRGTIWHPGCYEAQRRRHGGELDMSLEVTAR